MTPLGWRQRGVLARMRREVVVAPGDSQEKRVLESLVSRGLVRRTTSRLTGHVGPHRYELTDLGWDAAWAHTSGRRD